MTTIPRRTALRSGVGLAAGVAGVGATAACSPTEGPDAEVPPHTVVLRSGPAADLLDRADPLLLVRALLERASAVVVVPAQDAWAATAAPVAARYALPVLVDGPGLSEELDRLGVRTVLLLSGTDSPADVASREDLEVREVDPDDPGTVPDGLPARRSGDPGLLLHGPDADPGAVLEVVAAGCAAEVVPLEDPDPRSGPDARAGLRSRPRGVVVGVGALGEHFAARVRTARAAPELPGGGLLPFPGRRMVALYGHPSTAGLGMLGEQGPAASVERARAIAREYDPLLDEQVVPAFELIATVATAGAGGDGTYSQPTPVETLRPWVDAAEEAGIYVVLDLQPGRSSFLDQARRYTTLLRRPHVGLALDPEWRLGPDELPLQRVGSVGIDEVNAVGRWLDELVRSEDLPPKVLTLHQFRTSMIRDREDLETGLDAVQWLVHADGQGSQGQKQDTWDALTADLPDGVWLGWKNFEDEDAPMLTPARTVAEVSPTPWFVSYQ
ncbi:hypothetical protein KC207_02180 [Phycicoccus sp. BSK3Z-2]|uniref:Cell wall-binding repeat-containing protein n=1 Tax=Phycicoccus avicenniae TaxID=2828860 RepID=A0A941HZE9_9MICO|nr:hypothetical protein [Phycicoccus avicenniae]MBR7742099.1 hypothetical protein [Phycicoccus avicenniae]